MKNSLTILLFVMLSVTVFGQPPANEKTMYVNNLLKKGIMPYDTTTVGHTYGEVVIDWCLMLNPFEKTKKLSADTIETYRIHFFAPDGNHHLKNYQLSWSEPGSAFDRATCLWTSDTTLTVTLIQNDSDKTKTLSLVYFPSHPTYSAGIMMDDADCKKSKKKKGK